METEAKVEAAPPPTDDKGHSDRIVMAISTDPQRALADIAQQRTADKRRRFGKRAVQALLVLAVLGAVLMIPRFREHSLAAAPVSDAAPVPAWAESAAPAVASSVPVAPAQAQAEQVAVPEQPTAGCEDHFKAHQWRLAIETCGEAFDATPTPVLAMRAAHAHWARGDVAGARTWAVNALELGTQDPDAHLLIGNAEQAAGKRRKAVAAYRQYLELAPRGWHAERLRNFIRGAPAVDTVTQ